MITRMLLELQFRVYPQKSLMDAEPKKFEEIFQGLKGVDSFRIYDDRLSDATFITLVVSLSDVSEASLIDLKKQLLSVKKVKIVLVNASGEKFNLVDIQAREIPTFGKQK
ncbi:MAG: hypothetical protein NW226_08070 [Microscillaceae bacterium]|nr:hypothetical protein [Microscillaceae bacterium]